MDYQAWGTWATLLGSVFTGASVLVALETYRRNEAKAAFSQFRRQLLDIRQALNRLDALLGEPVFNEIATNITNELRRHLEPPVNGAKMVEFLSNEDNEDYVAQCIHLGRGQSRSLTQIADLMDLLERLPYEFREQLPVVSLTIATLTTLVSRGSEIVVSPRIFSDFLRGKPVKEMLAKRLATITDEPRAYAELTLYSTSVSSTVLKDLTQPTIDECIKLVGILTDALLVLPDAELAAESKNERAVSDVARKINNASHAEDLIEYLKLIRSLFTQEQWDLIVESRTRLSDMSRAQTRNKKTRDDNE